MYDSFSEALMHAFVKCVCDDGKQNRLQKRIDLCIKVPEYENENCLHLNTNSLCSASQSYNLSMPFKHK